MEPRQAQDAGAGHGHNAADPGPCTISGRGEVSDEAYPHQATGVRSERPWLEALAPDPRDPDIVRAEALARTGVPSSARPGLHTKVRCRHG